MTYISRWIALNFPMNFKYAHFGEYILIFHCIKTDEWIITPKTRGAKFSESTATHIVYSVNDTIQKQKQTTYTMAMHQGGRRNFQYTQKSFISFARLFKHYFIRHKHFFVRLFTLFYRNLFQLTLFRSCFSFNHVTRCSFSGSFLSRTSFNNIRWILLNIHMVVAYGRHTTTLYKLLALHWLLNKKRDARTDSLHLFHTNS